jgi:hypothetical protein
LALFGRLSAERAQSLVIAGVQKPAHNRTFIADEVAGQRSNASNVEPLEQPSPL